MYLKQTNLENRLHISESLKEDFNDTAFQHLVVELKQQYFCVYVQLCGCYCYVIACFAFFLFCMYFQYFSPSEQYLFVIVILRIFRNKMFALVLLSSIKDPLDYI